MRVARRSYARSACAVRVTPRRRGAVVVDRWAVERAVRQSTLDPPGRHLLLTLLTWADNDTASIPARFTPSLTTLERSTGLARSTVAAWLNRLEALGWVVRTRPTAAAARGRKARTAYALAVPTGLSGGLADSATEPRAGPSPGPAVSDSDGSAGPLPGPVPGGTGPAPGPALVRLPDRAGPGGGPNQNRQSGLPEARASPAPGLADHRYVEGANGYCAVAGCGRSAPLHGRRYGPSGRRVASGGQQPGRGKD
jgi:hypothetical protein